MYRPLPTFLTIKESKIHGLGLFSLEDLDSGVDLGMSHILHHNCTNMIRTPLGGFYNHSEDPNCERVFVSDFQWNLFTIRHVAAGEEILVSYTLYTPK